MKKFIKGFLFLFTLFCLVKPTFAQTKRVLVFSKTEGFRHHSGIAAGKELIMRLGKQNNFLVDTTESTDYFTKEKLSKYDALIFLCTTGNLFNDQQKADFKDFIESGGGFVGIHSATDTEHNWPWYGKLVGAYFKNHPPGLQEVELMVVNTTHPATAHLPNRWSRKDEIYNFRQLSPDIQVLIKVDESSYEGGENGEYHPISWFQNIGKGKAFYTGLGHDADSFRGEDLERHLLGGIIFAMD